MVFDSHERYAYSFAGKPVTVASRACPAVTTVSNIKDGWFQDFGPDDTGALIDLNLGTIEPGAGKLFSIFYGTATSETEAINAAVGVGAQVYSLGQVATDQGRDSGLPYTAMMAIDGSMLTNPVPPMFAGRWALGRESLPGAGMAQTFLPSTPGIRPAQGGS